MGERDGVAVSLVEGVAVGTAVGEGVMEKDEIDMEEDEVGMEEDEVDIEEEEVDMEEEEVDMEKDEVDMEEDEVALEKDEVVLEKFDDMEEDMAENISVKLRNMETTRGEVPFPSVN